MAPVTYRPDVKYRHKVYLITLFSGAVSLFLSVGFGGLVGAEAGGAAGASAGIAAAVLLNLAWIAPALLLIHPYYRSLYYEIHEDEVIVRAGVITKSVKHVPFRTVTNLKVNQGPFDRLFGIGSLDIQTAGMSGQSGAEEKLAGLPNHQEVYDLVATTLRRFRGAIAPTQAEYEPAPAGNEVLTAILQEVRSIRATAQVE